MLAALPAQVATPPGKLGLCVACHGEDGRSRSPEAPHIGGQNRAYLIRALQQYRDGTRGTGPMTAVAGVLKPADIEALAAWYARQSWPAADAADGQ